MWRHFMASLQDINVLFSNEMRYKTEMVLQKLCKLYQEPKEESFNTILDLSLFKDKSWEGLMRPERGFSTGS